MASKQKTKDPYDYMLKILILGDSAVGKSALLMKFCDNQFTQSHIATIGVDFKYKTIDCESKKYRLQVWDTAGQEKFRSIVQTYYKGAMGIILVYSINDRKSFENIENWMRQISANTQNDAVVILVGNKSDVEDRTVQTSEGERVASDHNIHFFETSAKQGTNVEEAFFQITKEIKKRVGDNPVVKNDKKSLLPENMRGDNNANVKLTNAQDNKDNGSDGNCKC